MDVYYNSQSLFQTGSTLDRPIHFSPIDRYHSVEISFLKMHLDYNPHIQNIHALNSDTHNQLTPRINQFLPELATLISKNISMELCTPI